MLARLLSALVFAGTVFVIGAIIGIMAQLLGSWFLPLLAISGIVGLVVFVVEVVAWALVEPPRE
jgi:hypothetical protein